jgi:hypothetical protein
MDSIDDVSRVVAFVSLLIGSIGAVLILSAAVMASV